MSVCLLVTTVRPAKTVEPNEVPLKSFRVWTLGGPSNRALDGGHDPPGKGNFGGRQCDPVLTLLQA